MVPLRVWDKVLDQWVYDYQVCVETSTTTTTDSTSTNLCMDLKERQGLV